MQVQQLMSSNVECISPDETLQNAARKMRELDVGPLPICADDRLVGMLTDRDIVVRGVAEGADPQRATVRNVMTPEVAYCFEDQDAAEASQLMKEKQIRRLVVLNREKRLVGMLALADLATDQGAAKLAEQTLERVSQPA